MNKYYLTDGTTNIELSVVELPEQFTDVMDGTFDIGSFECILTLQEFNTYKDNQLSEGEFIKREIYDEDTNELLNSRVFQIDTISFTKDSTYDEDVIKVTIRYSEKTKILTTFLMPDFTYSVKPTGYDYAYDVNGHNMFENYKHIFEVSKERNNRNILSSNTHKKGIISTDQNLADLLKTYPDYDSTYVDYTLYDCLLDMFKHFSSVPYLDDDGKLKYISTIGEDTNKSINYNEDNIVVTSSYSRSLEQNSGVIESKVDNVVSRQKSYYPYITVHEYHNENNSVVGYIRFRGLNEGLENYNKWGSWFIETPECIDNVDKLTFKKLLITKADNISKPSDIKYEIADVTQYIVEDSVFNALTDTEKKYYGHYKKGDNKIHGALNSYITEEDDIWWWEKTQDNDIAFSTEYSLEYTPILKTDILVVTNKKHLTNKKNVVINENNISDVDLMSRLSYESYDKNYSEYVLELAGKYQNVYAGEIVTINGFENYGIDSKKYLIYKVETTKEIGGYHQIIYFNEMVAKNNVLLNEGNIVRLTENLSSQNIVDKIYKQTDILGINCEMQDTNTYSKFDPSKPPTYMNDFNKLYNTFMVLFGNHIFDESNTYSKNFIASCVIRTSYHDKDSNLLKNKYLCLGLSYFNSGTVSQAICKAKDNLVMDYKANTRKSLYYNSTNNYVTEDNKLNNISPYLYTNNYGLYTSLLYKFCWEFPFETNSEIYNKYGYNKIDEILPNRSYYENGETYPELSNDINVSTSYFFDSTDNGIGKISVLENQLDNYSKDTRDKLSIVYEQTYYSDNEDLLLSNYFTGTSTAFNTSRHKDGTYSAYNYKDILIYKKRLYNPNIVNEDDAYLKVENAQNLIAGLTSGKNKISIILGNRLKDIPDGTDVTLVFRGVNNIYKGTDGNDIKQMVPQFMYRFKKDKNKTILTLYLTSDLSV